MYAQQPKKMLAMNILGILNRHTDKNHRLSQKEIVELLLNDYGMEVERKAVKRNLENLLDAGYDIECSESVRRRQNGEEETLRTDWYINRKFDDSELRLLIDSLLFSKHIPYSQCKTLIQKLKGLSNRYFDAKVRHVCNLPENLPSGKQLFYTIDVLDEAIGEKRQVAFRYGSYGIDKKPHPRKNGAGEIREYIVNPYQIVATNGRYYLIGNYDKYDNVAHYRLDRIEGIRLLEGKAKEKRRVRGLENGLDLPKHMAEHIYMFAGESVRAKFRFPRDMAGEVIDWFGMDVVFSDVTEAEATAAVTVNAGAMFFWGLQYGESVEILEPQPLRERVSAAAESMCRRYLASMQLLH
ncbi:MAG: WYL domain-containing protein [Clostridiales Family XIII bacterium]|jgi:predicted DNA-binding transcriptional regulator YafY|nr:WYL domain-containing protein [Clostridiales Family XIII bacterium]